MFERVVVGNGRINIVLKKDRNLTSTDSSARCARACRQFPTRASTSRARAAAGPAADSRDIMLYLGGDDPEKLIAAANQIAKEMAAVAGLRAPRVGGDLGAPEITIKPRFDLAADLGVTTAR